MAGRRHIRMRRSLMAAVVSAIGVVTIVAGALPAMASVTTTPPTEPTSTTFLDTSANTYGPTLVRDQAGGAHILYVRGGAGVYAYCAPTANCADSTQWAKVTIATSVDSRSSRLVLTPDGKPRILFGTPFRYASCDTACTTPAGWTVIDLSSKFSGFDDVQGAHSFAVDPQGRPRFAFSLHNPDDLLAYGLVYASCDAACTNVASWVGTLIRRNRPTTTPGVVFYEFPSLAFDSQGRPRMATEVVEHTIFETDDVYSAYLDCNSTCTDQANWSFLPLDAIPAAPPVLRLDPAGVAHLATYGNSLTHFACLGACAASAANWVGGPIGLPAGDGATPDMGFDSQGRPVLVFHTNSGGLGLGMGLATCISACNSAGSVWQARRVDSGTSPTYAAVGQQGCGGTRQAWVIGDVPSLATGPNGSIWVAHAGYHGYTDCFNNTFIDLNSVFVDQLPATGSGGVQKPPGDSNGDGKTDFGVYRPSTGAWYVAYTGGGTTSASWGVSGDIPVPGDYNGDGKTDFGIYRPSTGSWYVAYTGGGTTSASWGTSGDIPAPGDYNGDGKTDYGVFRPSTGAWYVAYTGGGTTSASWGTSGDIPAPGDYNGDGKVDYGIYRPSTGAWYVAYTGGGTTSASWGAAGDVPLPLPAAIRMAFFA